MPERDRWIVIPGWEKFQHRDTGRHARGLAWIKDYTDQLNKDAYRALTFHQRGLLRDIRLSYALTRGQLGASPKLLGRRLGATVKLRDLQALVDAGLIAISASRPPANGQPPAGLDVEREKDTKAVTSTTDVDADDAQANGNGPGFEIPDNLLEGVDDDGWR